jgi:hypothetical protein
METGDAPARRRLKVDLTDIADALENANLEARSFLDLETGQVALVTDEVRREMEALYEEIGDAEDIDRAFAEALARRDMPDWMREAVEEADRVEKGFGSRYLRIEPTGSLDAYRDIEAFIETVPGERLAGLLLRAIEGRGAFRRFRSVLEEHPRERERWDAFRDARARQHALDWLASEDIEPILE